MRVYTIANLRAAIEGLDDALEVVLNGDDHSYNRVTSVYVAPAEATRGQLVEYDDSNMEDDSNPVVPVLCVQ